MSTCCWGCTSWVRDGRVWGAWWGSLRGRGILQAAHRRGCATGGAGACKPCWRCCRGCVADRWVDLPGGMRAPRGEKFWQSSSREGRLECVDIEECGGVAWTAARRRCTGGQQKTVWSTGQLQGWAAAETDMRQAGGIGASFSCPQRRRESQMSGSGNSACVWTA
jgi:hypothetical protein